MRTSSRRLLLIFLSLRLEQMSFAERLAQRRDTPIAIFHRFRTGIKDDSVLHLFVEGYDDALLYERHLSLSQGEHSNGWKTYICYGKINMDEIMESFLSSSFTKRNVLFVRDSDFDDFLERLPKIANIVATHGYSVENYVCDPRIVKQYITSAFGVDPVESGIEDLMKKHQDAVETMFDCLSEFIGACLLAIKRGASLDLDKFDIIGFYRQCLSGVEILSSDLKTKSEVCGLSSDLFCEEAFALGSRYIEQDAFQWLRGKFVLECTSIFLKATHEDLRLRFKDRSISRFNRSSSNDFRASIVFEKLCGFVNLNDNVGESLKRAVNIQTTSREA